MIELGNAVVLLTSVALAVSLKMSTTFMEKSGTEDLETSASGYSYQVRSGGPFSYTSFNGDKAGKLEDFENEPVTAGRYSFHPVPLHLLPLSPNYVSGYNTGSVDSYGEMLIPYAKGFDNFLDSVKGISEPNPYRLLSTSFIKGGGSNYEDAEKASRGEKGERGYSNRDEFLKGSKGQHDDEQHKGYYDVAGGNKEGRQEIVGHYANKHQAAKAGIGGSFSNEKGHDKGSKTTGYHKVFHKDEYKKDHSFYDKADKSGHFNRYGDFVAKQGAKQGASVKGGRHGSGFKEGTFGVEGSSEKGRFNDESNGFKGKEGNEEYYKNNAAAANQSGKKFEAEKGLSEVTKFGEFAEE